MLPVFAVNKSARNFKIRMPTSLRCKQSRSTHFGNFCNLSRMWRLIGNCRSIVSAFMMMYRSFSVPIVVVGIGNIYSIPNSTIAIASSSANFNNNTANKQNVHFFHSSNRRCNSKCTTLFENGISAMQINYKYLLGRRVCFQPVANGNRACAQLHGPRMLAMFRKCCARTNTQPSTSFLSINCRFQSSFPHTKNARVCSTREFFFYRWHRLMATQNTLQKKWLICVSFVYSVHQQAQGHSEQIQVQSPWKLHLAAVHGRELAAKHWIHQRRSHPVPDYYTGTAHSGK